jgi:hypothetical protein
MITRLNTKDGKPVQTRVLTVAEFAAQLQAMIEQGQGDLPVFASDVRARYPFSMTVPLTASLYPDCLLIQPQPHLHAAPRQLRNKGDSYIETVNSEADCIRESCGAFA